MTPDELTLAADELACDELDDIKRAHLADLLRDDEQLKAAFGRAHREALAIHVVFNSDGMATAQAVQNQIRHTRKSRRLHLAAHVVRRLSRVRTRSPRRLGATLAAGFLLLIGIIGLNLASRATSIAAQVATGMLTIPTGERLRSGATIPHGIPLVSDDGATLLLPDGSRIMLHGGSQIELSRVSSSWSIVLTHGGAGFVVRQQSPHASFRIKLPRCQVAVIGTSFRLVAGATRDGITVQSGRVRVEHAHTSALTLTGGEGAVADDAALWRASAEPILRATAEQMITQGLAKPYGEQAAMVVKDGRGEHATCLTLPRTSSGIHFAVPPSAGTLRLQWRDDRQYAMPCRVLVNDIEHLVITPPHRNDMWHRTEIDLPPGSRQVRIEPLSDAVPATPEDIEQGALFAAVVRLGWVELLPASPPTIGRQATGSRK